MVFGMWGEKKKELVEAAAAAWYNPKMGHGFASSVGVCFVSQKHCVQPIFGFGSRYASAVGDSLSSVFPWYMNATSLFVVTLSLLGELGQESSADAIL